MSLAVRAKSQQEMPKLKISSLVFEQTVIDKTSQLTTEEFREKQ